MTNDNITRAYALTFAIEQLSAMDAPAPIVEKLEAMLDGIEKAKVKANASTNKTREKNEQLARLLHERCGDEPFTAAKACEFVAGIPTPQKAVAVLTVGANLGLFTKGVVKQRAYFTAVR